MQEKIRPSLIPVIDNSGDGFKLASENSGRIDCMDTMDQNLVVCQFTSQRWDKISSTAHPISI
ncbi:hypothetical protein DTL21_15320 [Bremerella cremea]|uniref:Uncharacterized protein n=1 Tax=Blastopirellula marina TaxID=124 RepID=A0A2S8FRQ1_9BACT|nr:hypothetical protein C5Y83_15305 [Blastopirellula marina]RCS47359.1 hypothetical protein DTL21_15320 [Bremerella cremea]